MAELYLSAEFGSHVSVASCADDAKVVVCVCASEGNGLDVVNFGAVRVLQVFPVELYVA